MVRTDLKELGGAVAHHSNLDKHVNKSGLYGTKALVQVLKGNASAFMARQSS